MRYERKPIDISEQVKKLCDRGLNIGDEEPASQCPYNISYYRLRAHTYPFQNDGEGADHEFLREDISFQDMINLYRSDRRSCFLILNVIEEIEAALRTRIALTCSVDENDAFWFLNHELYFQHDKSIALTYNEAIDDKPVVGNLVKKTKRSNEEFVAHYYQKYSEPVLPPVWVTLEVVSMGTLSKSFFVLDGNNSSGKTIYRDLGLYNVDILKNWVRSLSSLRNICTHHSRVWNRCSTIGLRFPYKTNYPFLPKQEAATIRDNKLFTYLSATLYSLQVTSSDSSSRKSLLTLLEKSPKLVVLKDMSFPEKWREYSLWKQCNTMVYQL